MLPQQNLKLGESNQVFAWQNKNQRSELTGNLSSRSFNHLTQRSSFQPGDKGGNTLRQATPLDRGPSEGKNKGVVDRVSKTDLDFYKIKIDGDNSFASFVYVNLADRGAISADLLNRRGKVFLFDGKSTAKTIRAGRFLTVTYTGLTEGTYYIRITTKRVTLDKYQLIFS